MTTQHINIHISLDGLRGHLAQALQRNILLVAGGLQNLQHLNPDFLELPTFFKMVLDPRMKWTKTEAEDACREWVLRNGFRDAIESVSVFLEEAHRVVSIWEITEGQEGEVKISGDDWNRTMISGGQQFHRLGFPDKLAHLRTAHEIDLDDKLSVHALSINKARNCLVHRGGSVSAKDVNRNNNALEVTWRRLHFFLQDEDGEKSLEIGKRIEKESTVCMQFDDTAKSFTIGSPIKFSVQEFSDSCWSLFLFGEDLIKKMNEYGLEKGFLKET